jgi:hypothetical protein
MLASPLGDSLRLLVLGMAVRVGSPSNLISCTLVFVIRLLVTVVLGAYSSNECVSDN